MNRLSGALAALALVSLAAIPAVASQPPDASVIDPNDFVTTVTNPYFPLVPGTTFIYTSETDEGVETNTVEVTHQTKAILGVTTTVVHDQVFLDGALTEDTFDWYAEDKQGDVWYFGEDSTEYQDGTVSTEGSWQAGVNDAQPGIIMEAQPQRGDKYYQEYSAGVAEDQAIVVGINRSVAVPYGDFNHCVVTVDFTPLEPGSRERKYYCPGIGMVLEIQPKNGRILNELVRIEH